MSKLANSGNWKWFQQSKRLNFKRTQNDANGSKPCLPRKQAARFKVVYLHVCGQATQVPVRAHVVAGNGPWVKGTGFNNSSNKFDCCHPVIQTNEDPGSQADVTISKMMSTHFTKRACLDSKLMQSKARARSTLHSRSSGSHPLAWDQFHSVVISRIIYHSQSHRTWNIKTIDNIGNDSII